MLLGQTEAKRLAGPTKLSSSGRFAMHILDLNEKQTGVASSWLGRGVELGLLSADIVRISYNVLYMQMQTEISALITIIRPIKRHTQESILCKHNVPAAGEAAEESHF